MKIIYIKRLRGNDSEAFFEHVSESGNYTNSKTL